MGVFTPTPFDISTITNFITQSGHMVGFNRYIAERTNTNWYLLSPETVVGHWNGFCVHELKLQMPAGLTDMQMIDPRTTPPEPSPEPSPGPSPGAVSSAGLGTAVLLGLVAMWFTRKKRVKGGTR